MRIRTFKQSFQPDSPLASCAEAKRGPAGETWLAPCRPGSCGMGRRPMSMCCPPPPRRPRTSEAPAPSSLPSPQCPPTGATPSQSLGAIPCDEPRQELVRHGGRAPSSMAAPPPAAVSAGGSEHSADRTIHTGQKRKLFHFFKKSTFCATLVGKKKPAKSPPVHSRYQLFCNSLQSSAVFSTFFLKASDIDSPPIINRYRGPWGYFSPRQLSLARVGAYRKPWFSGGGPERGGWAGVKKGVFPPGKLRSCP